MASTQTREEAFGTFLPNLAAWDADHDFSSGRAKGEGESLFFKKLWTTYKDIGTPNTAGLGELKSELEALDEIFPFLERAVGTTDAEKFQNIFLKDNEIIGRFKRFEEDSEEYVIKAKKIGNKPHGMNPKDTNWLISSIDLHKWLNPHEQASIAFSIDAVAVPFDDCLSKNDGNSEASAFLINTREAVNDAAGKTSVPRFKNQKVVELTEINDNDTSSILYPIMELDRINELTYRELFCSRYGITLSPIRTEKGKDAITINFADKRTTRQVSVLKGSKEDAHPNSVITLSGNIRNLLKFLTPGDKTNITEKTTYHTLIQGKRSGDWLQVLACLNPERYRNNLPANTRIFLATLDKLALVYGLIMGIDVLFTYKNGEDRWLVFFHKDINAIERSPQQKLLDEIAICPKPNMPTLPYVEARQRYITQHKSINENLTGLIISLFSTPNTARPGRFRGEPIEQVVKTALELATNLAIFREIAPIIPGDLGEERIFDNNFVNNSNLEDIHYLKNTYMRTYTILRKAIQARTGAASVGEAINTYLNNVFAKNGDGTKAQQDRNALIDKLQISGTIINPSNGGKNGVGIFSYLRAHLTDDECQELIKFLTGLMTTIPDGDFRKKFTIFFKTAAVLSGIPGSKGPSKKDLSNSALLGAIESIYPRSPMRGGADEEEDSNDPLANTFMASDFYPASVLLAERAQEAFILEGSRGGADMKGPKGKTDLDDARKGRIQRAEEIRKEIRAAEFSKKRQLSSRVSNHAPLTTFYFLLREISFRLTYDEDNQQELLMLSAIIHRMLNIPKSPSEFSIYKSFEYYLLETLPMESMVILQLMTNIKKEYYGFSGEIHPSYAPPLDPTIIQGIMANISVADVNETIEQNLTSMETLINLLKEIETQEEVQEYTLPQAQITPIHVNQGEMLPVYGGKTRILRKKKRHSKGSPRRRTIRKTRRHR